MGEWIEYRSLVECYLQSGAVGAARATLARVDDQLRRPGPAWPAGHEIEYWTLRLELALLERQLPGKDAPGLSEHLAALLDALKLCRTLDSLPPRVQQRVMLLEVLLCEWEGRDDDLLRRMAPMQIDTLRGWDPTVAVRILLASGRAAERRARPSEAEAFFRRAVAVAGRLEGGPAGAAFTALGRLLLREGRVGEAAPLLHTAHEMHARSGRLRDRIEATGVWAGLRARQGALRDALRLRQEVLRLARGIESGGDETVSRIEIGDLHSQLGEEPEARRHLLLAIRAARRQGAPGLLVRAYIVLAQLRVRHSPEKARIPLALAGRIAVMAPLAAEPEAEFVLRASWVHLARREFGAADEHARRAGELAERCGRIDLLAEARRAAGEIRLGKRQWGRAAAHLREAERTAESAQDACCRARSRVALGRALLCMARSRSERSAALRMQASGLRALASAGIPIDGPPPGHAARAPEPAPRPAGGPRRWARYGITTHNPGFHNELLHVSRIAPSMLPVLIHGETGAGKELVARAVHRLSGRSGRFVVFNAATCRHDLFEAELFGHRKGSFTGAHRDRDGLIVQARDGTLFLDEIADLDPAAQASLLRFLDRGEVRAVGADRPRTVTARIVAASHRRLRRLVERGCFRQDLFYRLAGSEVRIPPLRDRRDDILPLITHFARRAGIDRESLQKVLAPPFLERVIAHPWPGNVRQLAHWVDQLVALLRGGSPPDQVVRMLERGLTESGRSRGRPPQRALPEPSREDLMRILADHGGNISRVARELETYRTHVYRLLRQKGIDVGRYRSAT